MNLALTQSFHYFGNAVVVFSGAIPLSNAYFGRGTGAILIDHVSCTGSEQFLANCTNNGIGITSSFCSHYHDAGVQCPGIFFPQVRNISIIIFDHM